MTDSNEIVVDKYNVNDGDTVVVHVPVGGLEREKAQAYLGGVLNAFQTTFNEKGLENVRLFVFPHHPGKDRPSLQVVEPPPPGSTIIFNIPIGHVPKAEAPKYLKLVKQQLLSEGFDEKYPECKLLAVGVYEDGKRVEVEVRNRN